MENFIEIGKIVKTHGIKGEVRVHNFSDFPEERYAPGQNVYLLMEGRAPKELVITSHRQHKKREMLTFEGYTNINEVEEFIGGTLAVPEAELFELEDDEFYMHDIVGLRVFDEEKNELGKIKEILVSPAHDIWVVERPGKSDLLLPNIESVILDVAVDDDRVIVNVLEGLDTDED